MILYTERLILRPWEDADAEVLFEYAKDPRVGPAAGWPVHEDVAFSLECIRSILTPPDNFAVCLRETNMPIGAIGLKTGDATELTDRDDEAEIGYWLGVPFWGRGYMPEAVREIQRYAFCELRMSRLWCGYYAGNEKSRRVQEKCGFTPSYVRENVELSLLNEVRTEYVTTLYKSEWSKGRIVVRPANREDLPAINEIRRYVNDVHVIGRPDIFRPGFCEEMEQLLYDRFAAENWNVMVVELGGKVCGFAAVEYLERQESPYCLARRMYRVEEFGVDPAFHRCGAASALVTYMRMDAQNRGFTKIELDMWEFNTGALAFYEAVGFTTYRRYMELKL